MDSFVVFLISLNLYADKKAKLNNVETEAAYNPKNWIKERLIITFTIAANAVVNPTFFVSLFATYIPSKKLAKVENKIAISKIGICFKDSL